MHAGPARGGAGMRMLDAVVMHANLVEHDFLCMSHFNATQCCQIKINEICHSEGVAFFAADCFGLHASFFIDLNKHSYVK